MSRYLVVPIIATLLGASNAAAQEAAPAPSMSEIVVADPIRSELIVVTATGSPTRLWEVGQSITVIENVGERPFATVADLIATTPSVSVSRNGGIGGFSAVRIRGAEGEQTLTLIDGVRVNDPSSPGGGFDFANLLAGNIDRIEVLRGPNSVPWGSQAIGGVVNIVTAVPTRYFSGTARAEYGYKDATQLAGTVNGGAGPFTASVGGGWFRDDGVSAFKNGNERDGYRQYAAHGRLGIALTDNFDIDLRGYYADSRTQLDGFPPPFFAFADTPEFSKATELYTYAGANLRLFEGRFRNRIAFTRADISRDNFDAPGQAVPSFLARGRSDRFEYLGDAELVTQLRTVFGAEHETSRFNDGFTLLKTNVSSGFVQLIARPIRDLAVTLGGRVDDHKSYGTKATFSANAAWERNSTTIRLAYGEGFKAPTLFQLYSFYGNASLAPEMARSFEIGAEHTIFPNRVTVGLTLFHRHTRNQIDFISCFGQSTGICTNRPFGTYDNVKRSRARGVEAVLKLQPVDAVSLDANYSYIDAKDLTTGLTLLRRPKHRINLDLDWHVRGEARIGASLQLASDSADLDFQTFTRTRLDGYALASVRASVPIAGPLALYGRVDNLFDAHYETVSGYGTYGRNAHVGVRARF